MPQQKKHIIQKQVLEVEMQNPSDAFQFRNRLGEVFREKIFPELELLFDELAGADKTIRMDALEIDLGAISNANWEDELTGKALQKVKEILLLQNPVGGDAGHAEEEQFTGSFLNFLATGKLQWHEDTINFENELSRRLQPPFIAALKKFLKNTTDAALTRLIYQLNDQLLYKLLEHLLPVDFAAALKKAATFSATALRHLDVPETNGRLAIFMPAFKWLANDRTDVNQFYAGAFADMVQPQYPGVKKFFNLSAAPAVWRDNLLLQQIEKELASARVKTHFVDRSLGDEAKISDEEMYVTNAGLVLLHPFLPPLFSQLGLLEQGRFVNELAQMKAVLLSQFLVNGATEAEEHQLALNKLLCGVPLHLPVVKKIALTIDEMAEAWDLLRQVTGLWTKNGVQVSSTAEGLQEVFLQRHGKLTQQQDNWHLKVEQKAFDMLLSSVPWGFSIIKHSWMDGIIWVEWA